MISNFQGTIVKIPPGAVRGNFRLLSFAIIGNWNKVAGGCRFRASAKGDLDFKFHPSDDLIDAFKVSPGGRLLMAFRTEEVRDSDSRYAYWWNRVMIVFGVWLAMFSD
jgi:hypothetical protein